MEAPAMYPPWLGLQSPLQEALLASTGPRDNGTGVILLKQVNNKQKIVQTRLYTAGSVPERCYDI